MKRFAHNPGSQCKMVSYALLSYFILKYAKMMTIEFTLVFGEDFPMFEDF